ncbi:MAG TPA: hypothetical protein VI456_02045 [Polyangia bacterium]
MDTGNVIACNDEPQRYIDVQDDSRQTWRIMYAMTALDPTPFPEEIDTRPTPMLRAPATFRASLGSHVRFRFDAADFAGRVAWFLLSDESGPLVGAETWHSLREGDGGPFAINWGQPFERHADECGERVARALQISGDSEVSVPPGETRSITLHGTPYQLLNVHSVAVTPCHPDDGDWISWVLWRD